MGRSVIKRRSIIVRSVTMERRGVITVDDTLMDTDVIADMVH
jgi:hypothetical protein